MITAFITALISQILIWEIQKDTVIAWIDLGKRGLAPKLYCITRKGDEVCLSMEHVKGEKDPFI